jgi:hypothetical protein
MTSRVPVGITPEFIRDQVLTMRAERARVEHQRWTHTERQAGELNALDAVLRLINTGDWLTPEDRAFRQQVAAQREAERARQVTERALEIVGPRLRLVR